MLAGLDTKTEEEYKRAWLNKHCDISPQRNYPRRLG
jgi:hypothetical protein